MKFYLMPINEEGRIETLGAAIKWRLSLRLPRKPVAPFKNCPFRTCWGLKFRVWGPCAQVVCKSFGQRDGFVRTLCAHTQSFMIPLHSRECYHALYCTMQYMRRVDGWLKHFELGIVRKNISGAQI